MDIIYIVHIIAELYITMQRIKKERAPPIHRKNSNAREDGSKKITALDYIGEKMDGRERTLTRESIVEKK